MTEKPKAEPNSVVIKGGDVRIGAFAQGSGAQASYRQDAPAAGWEPSRQERDQLQVLLRELREAMLRQEAGLADAPAARQAVEKVSAELQRKQPDRSRLRRQLEKIAKAAGPAVEIAAAAATLGRAIAGA
jgi:hypothetical protein